MPSEKVLQDKQAIVAELKRNLPVRLRACLWNYKGITVADDTKLRKELREAGVEYSVVKNHCSNLPPRKLVTRNCFGADGTTAFAVAKDDPVAAAKISFQIADNLRVILGQSSFVEGKGTGCSSVAQLAKLPSREQLLGQLLSVLNGNISGLASAS